MWDFIFVSDRKFYKTQTILYIINFMHAWKLDVQTNVYSCMVCDIQAAWFGLYCICGWRALYTALIFRLFEMTIILQGWELVVYVIKICEEMFRKALNSYTRCNSVRFSFFIVSKISLILHMHEKEKTFYLLESY